MIKVLLLDLDGVLRLWDPTLTTRVEHEYGLPDGTLAAVAFAPHLHDPALTGAVDDGAWRDSVARHLAHEHGQVAANGVARAAVEAWMGPAGRVDPEVLELVRRVRTRLRVVLLANATSRLENDLELLGLTDEVDGSVSSSQLGLAMPDPDVFSRAALRNHLMLNEIAYVDAQPANIATAEVLGIRSHLYEGAEGLSDFVDELLSA